MTLPEEVLAQTRRERSIPVLETERLTLRAPRHDDVKAIAILANDRRIAANTARIPHPYGVADAEQFIASVNRRDGETCFVMMLDGKLIGACGIDPREDSPELGYWLGAPYWSRGFTTEAVRAVIDYAFGDLKHEPAAGGRPRQQPGVAPCVGEMRLPVDRCAPDSNPRHQFGGPGRSLPPRSRFVALAEGLGPGPPRGVTTALPAGGLLGLEKRRQLGDEGRSEMRLRI